MALKKSYTDDFGNVNAEAYHRIFRFILFDWDNRMSTAMLAIYKDKAARDAGKKPYTQIQYSFNGEAFTTMFGAANLELPGMTPQKAVYDHLKTLPEYEGAIDI